MEVVASLRDAEGSPDRAVAVVERAFRRGFRRVE